MNRQSFLLLICIAIYGCDDKKLQNEFELKVIGCDLFVDCKHSFFWQGSTLYWKADNYRGKGFDLTLPVLDTIILDTFIDIDKLLAVQIQDATLREFAESITTDYGISTEGYRGVFHVGYSMYDENIFKQSVATRTFKDKIDGDYSEIYKFNFDKARVKCDVLQTEDVWRYTFVTKFFYENCKAK